MLSRSWIFIAACIAILSGILISKIILSPSKRLTIGILQTASHPALDLAREGFIEEMRRLSGTQVDFIVQNAEGSLSSATVIASHFHAHQKIQAIYAIGTPAVQAAAKMEKRKPILIAAVSDPDSLGILHPGTNVCGTTDQVSTEAQSDLVLKLVSAVKTVAILHNPAEHNSAVMVKKMEKSLQSRGVQAVIFGVHTEGEIAGVVALAAQKAEALLIPNDNLLAAAMPLVAKEALAQKCPLIVSDIALVEKGALAAQGAEYAELGKKTAAIASRVLLLKESPEAVGIAHPTDPKTVINQTILEKLGLRHE